MKGHRFLVFAVVFPLAACLWFIAFPSTLVLWIILIDHYVPDAIFDIHHSAAFQRYHSWLVSSLPDREESIVPEIDSGHPEFEKELARVSQDWTLPVVIRGAAIDSEAYRHWHSHEYWISNWAKEEVLAYGGEAVDFSTVGGFLEAVSKNITPASYIGSASSIFTRNPALERMADSPITDRIEATLPKPEGERSIAQFFMGVRGMTTQPHCDLGAAVFRQIVGKKHWVWFAPSQSALLWPKLDPTGMALMANAHISVSPPHGKRDESEWIRKMQRYTAVVEAGDVVINPPWWWHGVTNCPDSAYCSQVAGSPFIVSVSTQHGHGPSAFMSQPVLTLNGALDILLKWGSMSNFKEKFNRKHVVDGRDAFERSQVETSSAYLKAAKEL